MVRTASGVIKGAARAIATPPSFPPFKPQSFRSRLHDQGPAAWLGIALGVTFTTCFVTGLISHLAQSGSLLSHQLVGGGGPAAWPARPADLYRVTQGLHVVAGLASVPLLAFKLFVVYPHLWTWPPVRGLRHAVERLGLLALVGASLFMLITGIMNVDYWYGWGFFFTTAHYWVAYIAFGAIVMHVGAKAHITRRVLAGGNARAEGPRRVGSTSAEDLRRTGSNLDQPPEIHSGPGGLTRRSVLTAAGAATGLVVLTTAGATVTPLQRLALLAPRRPNAGPQGFPVNKTADGAGVAGEAMDPNWSLLVTGNTGQELRLPLADLQALPQHEAVLPITCVEGWSATVRWRGVALRDLLAMVGAPPGSQVLVQSLQSGFYASTKLNPAHAFDPDTLIALSVGDEPLHIDHGFPARLITPNNPGVLQTKWLAQVTVL